MAQVADPHRAIFNFHAPPYGSNLDNAPKLDADMNYVSGGQALVPVGSRAVRESILAYGPPLSLHGHIHEGQGRGQDRLRPWRSIPGSSYEDGVLQAAIVDLDDEEGNGEALSADQRLTRSTVRREGGKHGIRRPARPRRCSSGTRRVWSRAGPVSTRSRYSFMSVNLVTLGMFYSLAVFAYVPGGEPDPVDRPGRRSR